MPRSPLAYLNDIIVCCDAIAETLCGVDAHAYVANRTLRSAVEREFTIIGEAVNSLAKVDSALAARISHAQMIVGFRNLLVHDYASIVDSAVWAIARTDAPILREECAALSAELTSAD